MNERFSEYSLWTTSAIAFLNVFLSIAQKPHMPSAFTDADLGAPYNRASSPKQSPCYRVFLISPLIMI